MCTSMCTSKDWPPAGERHRGTAADHALDDLGKGLGAHWTFHTAAGPFTSATLRAMHSEAPSRPALSEEHTVAEERGAQKPFYFPGKCQLLPSRQAMFSYGAALHQRADARFFGCPEAGVDQHPASLHSERSGIARTPRPGALRRWRIQVTWRSTSWRFRPCEHVSHETERRARTANATPWPLATRASHIPALPWPSAGSCSCGCRRTTRTTCLFIRSMVT